MSGLTPDQFWSMTERELELWFEGRTLFWERVEDLMSWAQANLINIHIPRGKPKLNVDKVRPKRNKAVVDTRTDDEIKDQIAEMAEGYIKDDEARERARDKRLARRAVREDAKEFWQSPEGASLLGQYAAFEE